MLDPGEREAFVQANRDFPLKKQTVVTALSTLKKSMAEEDSPSCLLLATEDGRVYVLEPDAFTILAAVQVASAPTFLDGQGLFDVDYHVAVACRDARLYIIKRGHKAAKLLAEPGAAAVGLCHLEGQLVVACTDDVLRAYSIKQCDHGSRVRGLSTCRRANDCGACRCPVNPCACRPCAVPGVSLLAVALRGRTVALHRSGDGAAVDSLDTDDDVSAMRFGRLGREENALVLVGTGGGLTVLILKRGAQLQREPVATPSPGPAKWSLPKKTKLFVDQTMREREHSVAMHRSFQRDLQRLRVTAARNYARALGSNLQPVSAPNQGHSMELSAQVQGLGPEYLLHLRLQNSRPGPVPTDLSVVIHSDPSLYKVPYLVPGLVYRLSTRVSCLVESGLSDVLKRGVIYKIPCNDCPASYIGETGRRRETRLKEHKRDVTYASHATRLKTELVDHTWTMGHSFDFDAATTLARKDRWGPRKLLESWWRAKAAAAAGSAATARASPVCAFQRSDVIAAADALAPPRAQLCASVAQ
ncbi:hypothetical protein HPB47_019578 [Ixodes persulcatus]|uniref:Uncharacterized protein n=1 Tax=Ixodes persulcatus TaxID=34615 RepID=A0AC60QHY7_IXOPE|nr:hypothetical protein HPB47_019578 [Ixodes persulcatus]